MLTRKLIAKDLKLNGSLYLLVLPVILFYLVFHYRPLYGIVIAFQRYTPGRGFLVGPWVGFAHFKAFFSSPYFSRVLVNTLLLSVYGLIFGFPAPIILALLINEVGSRTFKRVAQTISYLPHFISLVVVAGIIRDFLLTDGVVNDVIAMLGGERVPFLQLPGYFRFIYVSTDIWQEVGWGSIIYLAALSSIDPNLYEAASIDGAGRGAKAWHISLPSIMPTIVILLILRLGRTLSLGAQKILLLYNPGTYETADVISTYVFRAGLQNYSYSFSTAVGLFNSVVNFILLVLANYGSRRVQETSLW